MIEALNGRMKENYRDFGLSDAENLPDLLYFEGHHSPK